MATMPLLTPNESYKFQSALLEYAAAPEWSMYTNDPPDDPELSAEQLVPHREGSEHLAKATKDLMALDTSSLRWNESADRDVLAMDLPASLSLNVPFKPPTSSAFMLPRFSPSGHHHHPHALAGPLAQLQLQPLTVSPSRMLDNSGSSAASDSQQSISSVSTDTTPPPPTPPTLKRPYPSSSDFASLNGLSSGSYSGAAGSSSSSNPQVKKRRASTPAAQSPILSTNGSANGKPTLLTASQKKANHIQSEQKRRANIRKGYEALCETVPALREAILAEEEEMAAQAAVLVSSATKITKGKKKGRGKRAASESGEKLDGRAGPRSENVVLQKTIDYINDLLEERDSLLARLHTARCKLPHGHPALMSIPGGALWEREWSGGMGILDDGESDEDEDDT